MKAKHSKAKAPRPHPAIDSNEAAKQGGESIPLDQTMIAVMDSLLRNLDQATQAANEARARVDAYALQCAAIKGLKPEDFTLNWDLKAFVPKPPVPAAK